MPDREKVIKGLEHCRKTSCESCPYNAADVKSSNPICLINEMLSDALAMLKEQENELTNEEALRFIEKLKADNNELREKYSAMLKEQEAVEPYQHDAVWLCGNCDKKEYRYPFCRQCGRAVKWE